MEKVNILFVFLLLLGFQECLAEKNVTISEVCDQMRTLDEKIVKTLEKLPEGGGDELFKDLELYNDAVLRFVDFVVYQREEAVKIGKDLIKEKDSRFSKLPIDNATFKERFKWTDIECDKFKEMRWKAMDSWKVVHIFT